MASRIFDDEEANKIREEYKKGKTLKQLAIKYFCCESTIGNIVRCSGAYAQNGKPLEQCKKCPLRATFDPPKENCE